MFPLAAMVAGDPARGYQESRLRGQKVDAGDLDQQGMDAYGRTLATMFNSAVPGAQPMPGMPGQPSPSAGSPQPGQPPGGAGPPGGPQGASPAGFQPPPQHGMGLLQSLLQRLAGGGSGPSGGQPPQGGPQPGQPPMQMGFPGGPPGGGQGPPMMQPQQPPGQGPMQGGAPGAGGPAMDWRMIVQKVVQANPGIKDPRVIATAVDRFLPLMNQQSQQQWREMSMMLRQQQLDISEQRARTSEDEAGRRREQGNRRLDISEGAEGRRTRQGDERTDIQRERTDIQRGEAGRRKEQGDRRLDQGDTREKRLERSSVWRQHYQEEQLKNAQTRIQQGATREQRISEFQRQRAMVDAQHKKAQEAISSSAVGMPAGERKKLLDEEFKFYNEQIEKLRNMATGAPQRGNISDTTETSRSVQTWNPSTGKWE